MANYKCVFITNKNVMGASEAFVTPDVAPGSAANMINDFVKKRSALMFQDQAWQGVRVSQVGSRQLSTLIIPPGGYTVDGNTFITIPAYGSLKNDISGQRESQFRDVLQYLIYFGSNRKAVRYLSGIPKEVIGNEPLAYGAYGGSAWATALSAYFSYLGSSGWGIWTQQIPPPNGYWSVKGIVQDAAAPQNLGIQLFTGSGIPGANQTRFALSKFRPAKGQRASTLNGTWYLDHIDTSTVSPSGYFTLYLRNSSTIDPTQQNFTDKSTVRAVTYAFSDITYAIGLRTGIHKRGRPSTAPHGRRIRIPSLDA